MCSSIASSCQHLHWHCAKLSYALHRYCAYPTLRLCLAFDLAFANHTALASFIQCNLCVKRSVFNNMVVDDKCACSKEASYSKYAHLEVLHAGQPLQYCRIRLSAPTSRRQHALKPNEYTACRSCGRALSSGVRGCAFSTMADTAPPASRTEAGVSICNA